jgi:hypothetical protein
MDVKQFYTYKDGSKTELCKKCLTMHVDPFNPDTYVWLMEKMDVPYLPEEWNVLRDKDYAKNPAKLSGMAVFGKYLSKMKLKQYVDKETGKPYGYADSERLQNKNLQKKQEEIEAQKKFEEDTLAAYERGEISESQYKTLTSTEAQHQAAEAAFAAGTSTPPAPFIGNNNPYNEDNFMSEDELANPAADLTEEDRLYLAMKWGRLYKPNEWVELEKKYTEMMQSFDIQDSDTTGTLILICKTYLKMNQAIDVGDMDGFQKLSRVYDSLRKSAKFTAAQNKEDKNDFVDSVGELVTMCEKEGFIPRYATDIPQDKVDVTLKDMNNYVKKLVTQDLGFGQQIEDSIKKLQIQKEMRESDDGFDFEDDEKPLETQDYEEFFDQIQEQKEKDLKIFTEEEG